MKFTRNLALISAGFALTLAAPLNVLVVDGSEQVSPLTFRVGHAGANAVNRPDAAVSFAPIAEPAVQDAPAPCHGVRGKLYRVENYFRELLGLSPSGHVVHIKETHTSIIREPEVNEFIDFAHDTPAHPPSFARPIPLMSVAAEPPEMKPRPRNNIMWLHRATPRRGTSFAERLYKALQSLSPWEGRAMSFVLGCGLGVLLRMVWVFILLGLRALRSRDVAPRQQRRPAVVEDEAKQELLPPPEYDEKAHAVPSSQ